MALEHCPECNEQVSSDADHCPNCGNTLSKSVGCLLGLGIFLFPILFSWFTLRKGYSSMARLMSFGWLAFTILVGVALPSIVQVKDDGASSTTEQTVKRYAVDESFQLGNFRYKIEDFTERTQIGNQINSESPSDGAVFVVAKYAIENTGKDTSTVLTNDFKIRDSSGRTFSPSTTANTALNMEHSDMEVLLSQLQPGIQKQGMTAFEIPEQSTEKPLELIVPTKEMFSNKKAIIEFNLNE